MSLNQVVVIGRLTKDPELRYTPSGKAVANFNIANDRNYKSENGERPTDFHPVVIWGEMAEIHSNNISKGKLIMVRGRIENNNYEDTNGVKHYSYSINAEEIQYLTPLENKDETPPPPPPANTANTRGRGNTRR